METITAITETKRRRKNKRRTSAASAGVVMAAAVLSMSVLSGCSSAADRSSGEESAASNLVETIPADTENVSGDGSEDAAGSGTGSGSAADAASTIQEVELEEGEQILGGAANVIVPFEGTAPSLDVNWENMTDTCAWLIIPGTDINTGVLTEASDGHVWLDPDCAEDFSDPITVLEGSCAEGDVLQQIINYGDGDFFKDNPYMYVYMPNGRIFEFRVFAAYEHEHEDIIAVYNPYNSSSFLSYIESIFDDRRLTTITDASLEDSVISNWQVLTIDGTYGNGEDFILQATMTGQEYSGL